MQIGEKIKQIRKDKGLQQKQVAIDVGLDYSNYNKIENGHREPSLEVLQKLSTILGTSIDELVNAEDTKKPSVVTVEDKTISEKIKLMEQLEEEDKNVIYRMLDTMLTKQRFQNFFEQNLQTAK
jgi:transcriptional regulator with XRE-family HTH domain